MVLRCSRSTKSAVNRREYELQLLAIVFHALFQSSSLKDTQQKNLQPLRERLPTDEPGKSEPTQQHLIWGGILLRDGPKV